MRQTAVIATALGVLLLGAYLQRIAGGQQGAVRSVPRASEATDMPAPLLPGPGSAGAVRPLTLAEGEALNASDASDDRAHLAEALRGFAAARFYAFEVAATLVEDGRPSAPLTSSGRVRDHRFTHLLTTVAGAPREVVARGGRALVRASPASAWEGVGALDLSLRAPAGLLEILDPEMLPELAVVREGETAFAGRRASPLAVALAPEEASMPERVRFHLDAQTGRLLGWTVEAGAGDERLEVVTTVWGFDEPWSLDLPEEAQRYLERD